jgi:hypothetical protein
MKYAETTISVIPSDTYNESFLQDSKNAKSNNRKLVARWVRDENSQLTCQWVTEY